MSARNELEALLRDAPLDDASFVIYGDCLQAEGDPRGELIALDDAARHAAPETHSEWRQRRAQLLERHPELAPARLDDVLLTWHLGFVRRVQFETRLANQQLEMLAHPALRYVTSIAITDRYHPGGDEKMLVELVDRLPRTVRSFAIGESWRSNHWNPDVRYDIDPLFALPNLEELVIQPPVRFTSAPRLRSLELVDGSPQTLAMLAGMKLDALESLALHLSGSHRLLDEPERQPLDELAAILSNPPPRLTSLALFDVPNGNELVASLATSPVLLQLRTLRLWSAGLTEVGARHITRDAYGHLELLDLSDAGMDDATVRLVAGACREVRTIPLRLTAPGAR